MDIGTDRSDSEIRFSRLLNFLEQDPANPNLLRDAAVAAFEARDYTKAVELIDRHAEGFSPTAELINMSGLAAIHQQRFADAIELFESLLDSEPRDPRVAFNLAWAHASLGHHQEALELLVTDAPAQLVVPRRLEAPLRR